MSVDLRSTPIPVNRQATHGMSSGADRTDMTIYRESTEALPHRRNSGALRRVPKSVKSAIGHQYGGLKVLGLAMGSTQLVSQCDCGRYVQRPIAAMRGGLYNRCTICLGQRKKEST
jgi:hypothetical protein